jgi:hypothetical protein
MRTRRQFMKSSTAFLFVISYSFINYPLIMSKFTALSIFSKDNISESLNHKLDIRRQFNHSITSYIYVHGEMKQISIGKVCI